MDLDLFGDVWDEETQDELKSQQSVLKPDIKQSSKRVVLIIFCSVLIFYDFLPHFCKDQQMLKQTLFKYKTGPETYIHHFSYKSCDL